VSVLEQIAADAGLIRSLQSNFTEEESMKSSAAVAVKSKLHIVRIRRRKIGRLDK